MLIYLILLCFFFGFLFLDKKININIISAIFFSVAYLLITGLRGIDVGEDSVNYFNNYFLLANDFNSITELLSRDVVFKILNYIILFFGSGWYYYAFVMSSVSLLLVTKINNITKNKNSYLFLVLLLTCPIFLENTINILRTTLCSLTMFYGYLYLDKNKKYGIFIILLGFGMHYLQGGILLLLSLLPSRLDFIKTNKRLNIFIVTIILFTVLKNFLSFINFDSLLDKLKLLQIILSDDFNSNYTITQIIGSLDVMSINQFVQLLLYLLIPLLLINFDKLNLKKKILMNYVLIAIVLYVFLFPQVSFAIRLIPISLMIITSILTFEINKFTKIYCLSILTLNLIIAFINVNSW
jgi:hypothetical protein